MITMHAINTIIKIFRVQLVLHTQLKYPVISLLTQGPTPYILIKSLVILIIITLIKCL